MNDADDSPNMIDVICNTTKDSIDIVQLREDENELVSINNRFPTDGIIDITDAEVLAGLSMRGITICDYWIPILMVALGDLNSQKNKAKNEAYVNAKSASGERLTADLRKHISEIDPVYNDLCLKYDRIKSLIRHFEDKRDSFKTFHLFMKDKQKAYNSLGGRHINGEIPQKSNSRMFSSSISANGEEDF